MTKTKCITPSDIIATIKKADKGRIFDTIVTNFCYPTEAKKKWHDFPENGGCFGIPDESAGVYLIKNTGGLIYIGMSDTQGKKSFSGRISKHRHALRTENIETLVGGFSHYRRRDDCPDVSQHKYAFFQTCEKTSKESNISDAKCIEYLLIAAHILDTEKPPVCNIN